MGDCSATCRLACVAGDPIQPRCGLQRRATRDDNHLAAGGGHQSRVMPQQAHHYSDRLLACMYSVRTARVSWVAEKIMMEPSTARTSSSSFRLAAKRRSA